MSGARTSGVAMSPWACEHALEHGGVRLGEAGPGHGEQRLVVGATLVDLAGQRALDHLDVAAGAHVRRRPRSRRRRRAARAGTGSGRRRRAPRSRPAPRRAARSVPTSTAPTDCLTPMMFARVREAQEAVGLEEAGRCGSGCCRARSAPGSPRRPPRSGRRSRPGSAAGSTGRRRAPRSRSEPGERLDRADGRAACCSCRRRRSRAHRAPGRRARHTSTTARCSSRLEQRRLAGRAERHEPGDAGVEVACAARRFERVERRRTRRRRTA